MAARPPTPGRRGRGADSNGDFFYDRGTTGRGVRRRGGPRRARRRTPRPDQAHEWVGVASAAGAVELPRAAALPDRARPQDPLPADRSRRGLGGAPAARARPGDHALLRPGREGAARGCAVPDLRLQRDGAVDPLLAVAGRRLDEPDRGLESDLEGLLPAA